MVKKQFLECANSRLLRLKSVFKSPFSWHVDSCCLARSSPSFNLFMDAFISESRRSFWRLEKKEEEDEFGKNKILFFWKREVSLSLRVGKKSWRFDLKAHFFALTFFHYVHNLNNYCTCKEWMLNLFRGRVEMVIIMMMTGKKWEDRQTRFAVLFLCVSSSLKTSCCFRKWKTPFFLRLVVRKNWAYVCA